MLLESVTLKDFAVYRGVHTLDLSVDPQKPKKNIILIGGQNGSGKTSLLEAIRLCLYGPQVLDGLSARKTYQDYVLARANRDAIDDKNPNTSIKVDFSYSLRGRDTQFSVERSWALAEGKVRENLEVIRDGVRLRDIEMDHWQHFLNELIPPGVTQFFFFDAEQIQNLAQDGDSGAYLVDAINALLDIDILDRVNGDLHVLTRKLRKESEEQASQTLREATQAVELQKAELQILKDQLESLLTKERELLTERDEVEKSLHKEGVILGLDRKQLQEEIGTLQETVRRATADLQQLYSTALPLGITPDLAAATKHQVEGERRRKAWESARSFAETCAKGILGEIEKRSDWQSVPDEARQSIAAFYLQRWHEALEAPPADAAKTPYLRLSDFEEEHVLQQFSSLPKLVADFRSLVEAKVRAEARLAQVKSQLAKAPQGSPLENLLRKLSEHDRALGGAQADQARIRESIKDAEAKLRLLERARVEALAREDARTLTMRKQQLVDRVSSVIDSFRASVLTRKAKELEEHISQMIRKLARKQDLVHGIKLDPKTYEVTLLGRRGKSIPKEQLSAGEKQIYAISMLWGLAQTSGRRLPIIIDTPLGRLDTIHRSAIIEHYFPAASHQVIVLSTDTEVDQRYYSSLEKHIAHAYHLKYRSQESGTRVDDGYFWRTKEAV
jgi:DNA sulfur modification protein DndD